jgi:Tol biopolymer transport system component
MVAFSISDAFYGDDAPEGVTGVFVRSRTTHRTSRVSVALNGAAANGDSDNPTVSADGTRVAFVSEASNLVEGDTNGVLDVFVRDLIEHVTLRVSVSSNGAQGNGASGTAPDTAWSLGKGVPAISADGRYVAFESTASNLAPNDSNSKADVFIHDLQIGDTFSVSVAENGRTGNSASRHPSISADGRVVAFYSEATDLTADTRPDATRSGVFIRDLADGKTTLASVSASGGWLPEWNGWPSMSGSGKVVAFINIPDLFDESPESSIDEGGDIVRRDLEAGTTTRVDPKIQSYHMKRVVLSGDGDATAFVHLIGGMDAFC